ncbi:MAG: L-serine ammonia-lyase, iron-sulfur-dependent, subunit alpha [Clostridiales bacterium]|nr:L-serine ammonia-lyase, iron-sulfur-dependent, subunit alpha [Clostridiales bacterium]
MLKQPASIFNDVIGPVMRGASSSHVAASVRIGRLARQMIKGNIVEVIVEFNKEGSLATTYHGHGSDIGLVAGLLNYDTDDERLSESLSNANDKGINISFHVVDYVASHPNTYKMKIISDIGEVIHTKSISTGGGMIEFEDIQGYDVSIEGGYFETLIFLRKADHCVEDILSSNKVLIEDINFTLKSTGVLINIKSTEKIDDHIIEMIKLNNEITDIISLAPVLPIMSYKKCNLPFRSSKEMLEVNKFQNKSLWELAVDYESIRGNISKDDVLKKMKDIVEMMYSGIIKGLNGTDYQDRILHRQSHKIKEAQEMNLLVPGNVMNRMISYITALMEIKSSMGVFVAAPTAGSCGGLPGTILSVVDEMDLSVETAAKALLAAGIIGVFIAEHATFAAEVGGCQAECGAGSSMAAAGLVELMGGSATKAVDAASMALQNVLGLICDPVADRVEAPCLGKNILAGSNALSCANMALAGFDKVIPFDETVETMLKVGKMMVPELRCTGKGGLSITDTAKEIYINLNKNNS